MNDRDNIKNSSAADENLHGTVQQVGDEVTEIEAEELEQAAGGSDGWAIGHN